LGNRWSEPHHLSQFGRSFIERKVMK
jgi:hypothetical protein